MHVARVRASLSHTKLLNFQSLFTVCALGRDDVRMPVSGVPSEIDATRRLEGIFLPGTATDAI